MTQVLIDAHRGSCEIGGLSMPEAFQAAFEARYDFVELDVRKTADSRMVVHHDPFTPSGSRISDLSFDQYRRDLAENTLLFDELLDMAARADGHLHVDIKEPVYEAEIVRLVLSRFEADRFVVTGGDPSVRAVKDEFPQVQAGLSLGEGLEGTGAWQRARVRLSELFPARRVRACRADFVAVDYRLASAGVLRYCDRAGLPAWVWTVDDERQMARFLADPRVTVLITNRPALARRLRGRADG